MKENKVSSYLLYAIGEIILVVIGILIAVSINNWNADRKNHQEEILLLEQLESEFQSNLEQLEDKIAIRNSAMKAALRLLIYIDYPEKRNADSTLTFLGNTITAPTFDPIVNDQISAGQLQLLSSNKLKKYLSLWSSEIIQVKEEEIAWKKIREEQYFPFLIAQSSFRSILNSYFASNQFSLHLIDKEAPVLFSVQKKQGNYNINAILQHPDLEDHLTQCAAFHTVANIQSEIMRKRILEILAIIRSQLNPNS